MRADPALPARPLGKNAEKGPKRSPKCGKIGRNWVKNKILVMDDEPMVQNVLGKMLLAMGYEVESAQDGVAARELYTRVQDTKKSFCHRNP